MASPQSTATTTTATPQPVAPARMGTIFGIVGAVLAIAGFFLPWTLQATPDPARTPGSSVPYTMVSGWDIASEWLHGLSYIFAVQGQTTKPEGPPLYTFTLIFALPLILAVVVLVVCAIALKRRPGPVLSGLFVSAAILGLLGVLIDRPTGFIDVSITNADTLPNASSWVGIGIIALYLGYFGIVAGGVMMALSQRQAASQG